jgi:MFS family permease
MPAPNSTVLSPAKISLTITSFVAFTFIGYFTIGLPLAVLPIFIHHDLGYSAMVAGVVISMQYVTTFVLRGYAGGIVDKQGPKPAVLMGMIGFALSGVLLFIAYAAREMPAVSLGILMITRLMRGFAEGLIGLCLLWVIDTRLRLYLITGLPVMARWLQAHRWG